jgi:phosphoglycerol transferase MdoB-like AlkP superfamily enzyme
MQKTERKLQGKAYVSGLTRISIYLSVFAIFLTAYYFYKLELSFDGLSAFSTFTAGFLLLSGIIIEYLVVLTLVSLFSRLRYFSFLSYLILLAYVAINIIQIISFEISSVFVTRLALANAEFIKLLITTENVSIVVYSFLLIVITPLILTTGLIKSSVITGKPPKDDIHLKTISLLILGVILCTVLINNAKYWMPEDVIANRSKLLRNNSIKRLKPVDQFVRLFQGDKQDSIFPSLSKGDVEELRKYGFSLNPDKLFPLLKDKIYHSPPPFVRDNQQKPNVILIFAEGFSARTAGFYSEKYPDLTPNLEGFSRDSMLVSNYYNHTAATYRGLHGGLCSLYPKYGALGGWLDSFEDIPKTNYRCLTDIFQKNGYTSFYLDPHFKDTSGLDEMMSQLKFEVILNAENLLGDYLNNEKSIRPDWLTDRQMYRSLVGFLKQRSQGEPFFLTMYSVETHAWVDVVEDGVKYRNGELNVLNTIRNTDHAFGQFWNYYKNSKYADNTIIIFTSDHAHYYENAYVDLMKNNGENNYQKLFVDRIPMIIHDPTSELPDTLDANYATSIDLAPSLIHLLGLPNEKNPFLGSSIFDRGVKAYENLGIASYEGSFYLIDHEKVHDVNNSETYLPQLDLIGRYIKYVQALEVKNRIFP